jgi:5-methylcytosine-specific restriction endonuclease McrA
MTNAERKARYNARHKEQVNVRACESYRRHKAKRIEQKHEHHERNRGAILVQRAAYRVAHREAESEYAKRYLQEHLAEHADYQRKRYARKLGVVVEHVDRRILFERDEGVCGICRKPVDRDDFHVDHVIPLARGGEHSYANTQIAHPPCNLAKGAKVVV